MDEKIIPFTELDHKQMLEMRKAIFKPEFIEIMDDIETKLSEDNRGTISRIFEFLLNLIEEDPDRPPGGLACQLIICRGKQLRGKNLGIKSRLFDRAHKGHGRIQHQQRYGPFRFGLF